MEDLPSAFPEKPPRPFLAPLTYMVLLGYFLFAFYLLSIGPMLVILPILEAQGFEQFETFVEKAYKLWFAFHDHSPEPLQSAIDRYVTSWVRLRQ